MKTSILKKSIFIFTGILFLGCATKTETIVQYKKIKTQCPTVKINKVKFEKLKLNAKVIEIGGKIYIALPKSEFLELTKNYKFCKKELNSSYGIIDNFNKNIIKLNKDQ